MAIVSFFKSPARFRSWLEAHHAVAAEVYVGFYRKDSGRTGITYQEALDEALCFGWIDGVRRSVDALSYTNRFTPRRPTSAWSAVNVRRVAELMKLGRMRPSGIAAFERRDRGKPAGYSRQDLSRSLDASGKRRFKANPRAWTFFRSQPPGYQRTVSGWVMSAKKAETRERRLALLLEDSAHGRRLAILARPVSVKGERPVRRSRRTGRS
ncbi:MAG TPA: YdeI/OmpD-associated family protein [Gemmatimonadaceae bacterium]|nr:YdeI/OmpD-associated family protein [Gemmatimonadaceae bacterium]